MMNFVVSIAYLLLIHQPIYAWLPIAANHHKRTLKLDAAVGIYFGTSTGNTEACADRIYEAIGPELAAAPVDVDSLTGSSSLEQEFAQHGALIVGTPTWNTGADTQRSGTGWDELYYSEKLPFLENKKVAVFGLGDQVSYGENYADATGELYDVFEKLKCDMVNYAHTSQEGYEHEDSKSIRGDKFCGLLLDEINQDDLTDERIEQWVEQLREGGFFDSSSAAPSTTSSTPAAAVVDAVVEELEQASEILDETIAQHSSGGFTPHYNPVNGKTMWTSPDGRKSYVTSGAATVTPTTNVLHP